jgi:hypothetical protein
MRFTLISCLLIILALDQGHAALSVEKCNHACDNGSAKKGNDCCMSYGFESGYCKGDAEAGVGVYAASRTWCTGGDAEKRIANCDTSNSTFALDMAGLYKDFKCEDKNLI